MKKTDFIPIVIVVALGGFIAVQAARVTRLPPSVEATADTAGGEVMTTTVRQSDAIATAAMGRPPADIQTDLRMTEGPSAPRDVEDIRRRLRLGESGTYLGSMLGQLDSSLYRWHDRMADPLRVWVAPPPGPDPDAQASAVRAAFGEWAGIGIPVRFTFVVEKVDADILVGWVDHFTADNRIGNTRWVHDQNLWMQPGTEITIATHYQQGQPISNALIGSIAVHEIGHLLGLPHSPDTSDIMFPKMHTPRLSAADRATVRLLYSVSAGPVK